MGNCCSNRNNLNKDNKINKHTNSKNVKNNNLQNKDKFHNMLTCQPCNK